MKRRRHDDLPFPTTSTRPPVSFLRLSPRRALLLLSAILVGAYFFLSPSPGPAPPLPLALTQGSWKKNRRIHSNASVEAKWGAPPTCPGGSERGVQVSAWEWTPSSTTLEAWDTLRVIERLLNSQGGLVLVGDSVTTQTHETLEALFRLPSSRLPTLKESLLFQYEKDYNIRTISVAPASALHVHLMRTLPHVPLSRLLLPFAQTIRHDTLLSVHEIGKIAAFMGMKEPELVIKPWLLGENWEKVVHEKHASEWEGIEKSVLVLNTGAHWSRASFGPGLGKEGVMKLYRAMVQKVISRLPAFSDYSIVYRTTSPTHENCDGSSSPIHLSPLATENAKHLDWDWDDFPKTDMIWKDEIEKEMAREGGASMTFLNVTEMAGRRPDAHLKNNPQEPDCLHWCLPTIPGTWMLLVWTLIARDWV